MRRSSWLALLILLIAFGLRIYRLGAQSLWLDEALTAHQVLIARLNPSLVETRGLLYSLLTASTGLIIPNEFGLRFPAVLAGTLSVALNYQIGKQFHSIRAGLIAITLLAVLPVAIYLSQETRFYSFVICSALFTLWCILLTERDIWWARFVYPLGFALTPMIHLMTLPWLLALLAVLAIRQWISGKGLGWGGILIACFSTVCGIGIVELVGRLYGFSGTSGTDWISEPNIPNALVTFVLNSFGMAVLDVTDQAFRVFLVLAAILIMLTIVALVRFALRPSLIKRGRWQAGWSMVLIAVLIILPITAGFAFSFLVSPVWLLRYFMPSVICVGLLTAIVLASLPVRVIRIGLTVALVACALVVLNGYYHDPRYGREDWRGAVAFLEASASDDDYLIPYRSSYSIATEFYAEDNSLYWDYEAPMPDQPEFEAHLRDILDEHPRVWIITRTTETEVNADGWLVSPALDTLARRVAIHRFFRVYVYEYNALPPN